MKKIPKIIHQIWGGNEELPIRFRPLAETWKKHYPDWKYEFWDDDRINKFVLDEYPQYYKKFLNFPYNIQRWDAARYLILNKIGGMYVDFDYKSIKSLEPLVEGKECCIALDPESHCEDEEKYLMLNPAMMLSIPNHWFIKRSMETIFSKQQIENDTRHRHVQILTFAGPGMLIDLYYSLNEKEREEIYLIPDKLVTPINCYQSRQLMMGKMEHREIDYLLHEAYAIHYFSGDWI